MADKFSNYAELSKCMTIGRDYRIVPRPIQNSRVLIAAPHGGKIESGTSEITRKIAANNRSYYLFEGLLQNKNRDLHITSHNFDEPKCLEMVLSCEFVLGIHGRADKGDTDTTFINGLDQNLIMLLDKELKAAGFKSAFNDDRFPAKKKNNICNRGQSGKGAQVEIPRALRDKLLATENAGLLETFVNACQTAIATRLS